MPFVRLFSLLALLNVVPLATQAETFEIYIDADYTHAKGAAHAIEHGVRTALEEVDYRFGDHEIVITPIDHRANVKRAGKTYEKYTKNDRALAIIGGLHSPTYLTHQSYINNNNVLTLLPWSAAGPITRSKPGEENWIFRLSVDDSKSTSFFIKHMVDNASCERIAFLLIDTGWGQANHLSLTAAFKERGISPVMVEFFPASIGAAGAGTFAARVAQSNADCAVFLANWDNGAIVINAMAKTDTNIKVFSHWGITSGNFHTEVTAQTRDSLDLKVLQTCGLKQEKNGNAVLQSILERKPGVQSLSQLSPPTGFVHGYDLTRVLLSALKQAAQSETWGEDIKTDRAEVRRALENLNAPVDGILRHYERPFSSYSEDNKDAHEALRLEDLCLARFDEEGLLVHAE